MPVLWDMVIIYSIRGKVFGPSDKNNRRTDFGSILSKNFEQLDLYKNGKFCVLPITESLEKSQKTCRYAGWKWVFSSETPSVWLLQSIEHFEQTKGKWVCGGWSAANWRFWYRTSFPEEGAPSYNFHRKTSTLASSMPSESHQLRRRCSFQPWKGVPFSTQNGNFLAMPQASNGPVFTHVGLPSIPFFPTLRVSISKWKEMN